MARSDQLPPPTFDLDTWASNYDGTLLPLRFALVAARCPTLAHASLTLALNAARSGRDTALYRRICGLAGNLGLEDLATVDDEWATHKDEENKRELQRLEGELRGYKNNLIRESIRMGQEDLATHHLRTGGPAIDPSNPQPPSNIGYGAAYQAFGKMRDYCTTPTHVASMTLRLLYTALVQAVSAQQLGGAPGPGHYYTAVLANASRLRNAGVKEEEQNRLSPIAWASTGIAYLGNSQYREAANAFIRTSFDYHTLGALHGADFSKAVASANDIAIYGGLCALATFSRQALIDTVLGGNFRQFLELEPHMRKAISLYTTAKYQACLATLQRYYSDWSVDIFLGAPSTGPSHLDFLLSKVREKSITAHFSSFSEVSLSSLASTFPPLNPASQDTMEDEVLSMIQSGMLNARLDVVNGILVAPQAESRATTHENAKKTAEEVERMLLLRLHKVNATLAGCEVLKPKGTNAGGASGGWESNTPGNGY